MGFAESSVWCGCPESTVFGQSWGGAARLLTAPENTTHHRAAHRSPSVLRLDTNYQLREWERGRETHSGIYSCTGLEANVAEWLNQRGCPEDVCGVTLEEHFIRFLLCKACERWILHLLFKNFNPKHLSAAGEATQGQQKQILWTRKRFHLRSVKALEVYVLGCIFRGGGKTSLLLWEACGA